MAKRHQDAIVISDGACNPSGIAHSIIDACAEIRDAGGGSAQLCADAAIRLMVHQLGYLVGFDEFKMYSHDGTEWFDWRRECRDILVQEDAEVGVPV